MTPPSSSPSSLARRSGGVELSLLLLAGGVLLLRLALLPPRPSSSLSLSSFLARLGGGESKSRLAFFDGGESSRLAFRAGGESIRLSRLGGGETSRPALRGGVIVGDLSFLSTEPDLDLGPGLLGVGVRLLALPRLFGSARLGGGDGDGEGDSGLRVFIGGVSRSAGRFVRKGGVMLRSRTFSLRGEGDRRRLGGGDGERRRLTGGGEGLLLLGGGDARRRGGGDGDRRR